MALFSVFVILIVLVMGDRVAKAIAENQAASQMRDDGFPARPAVDIKGWPFLTQVAARDIKEVDISASNVIEGPVEIASVNATATGVHLGPSYNSGVIDHVGGSALITFSSLAVAARNIAGNIGGGDMRLTFSAAGPDKVNISAGPVSEQATIETHGDTITFQIVDNGDMMSEILNSLGSFSVAVPQLPEGMKITGTSVIRQGVRISAAAQHVRFPQ